MRIIPITLLSAAVMSALSGCAVTEVARKNIDTDMSKSRNLLDAKRRYDMSNVQHSGGLYLGDQELKASRRSVPPIFDRPFEMSAITGTVSQIAEKVSSLTGIDISAREDVGAAATSTTSATPTPAAVNPVPASAPAPVGNNPFAGMSASPFGGSSSLSLGGGAVISMRAYKGTLKGYLTQLASRAKMSWKFENGRVAIFTVETRVFTIDTLPGTVDTSNNVGSSGGTSNSGSSSSGTTGSNSNSTTSFSTTHTTQAKSTIDPWAGLVGSVGSMLSSRGKVVPSPATNSLVVTDTPEVLDAVADYLAHENAVMSKRVDLYVNVYSVKVSNGDNYGINWDTVYQWLGQNASISFSSGASANASSGTNGTSSFSFKVNGSGPWAGSQAILSALSSQGDVTEMTSAHVAPLNNRTAPIYVGRQISYAANTSSTMNQSMTQTSITPGTIDTGFNLSLLPTVLEKNRIGLRYAMDINALLSLKTFASPDKSSAIQTPEVDRRSMMLETAIKNGETLVIAGLQQNSSDISRSGVGSPNAWALGGNSTSNTARTVLVVVISAYLH